MSPSPQPLTREQVSQWFYNHGIAISEWCRRHNIDRFVVADLLRGNRVGRRGKAHRAAILLGMKADPETGLCQLHK